MVAKKYSLTTGKDNIVGSASGDLIVGALHNGKPTIASNDSIDGRGGYDTLNAVFAGDDLALHAKSVEKVILGRKAGIDCELDLAGAAATTSLVLRKFDDNLAVSNATHLNSISLIDCDPTDFSFNDIDTDLVGGMRLSFTDTTNAEVAFYPAVGAHYLKTLDVTLKSSNITLDEAAIASTVRIHSNGKQENGLYFIQDDVDTIVRKIVIDGATKLDFGRMSGLPDLVSIDASKASGSMATNLNGSAFVSYRGSRGTDFLSVNDLGGALGHKAVLNLGGGNDSIDSRGFAFDGALHHIVGGAGRDDLLVLGGIANSSGFLVSVEQLRLASATGSYHLLGSGVSDIEFVSAAAGQTVFDGLRSGATLEFMASQTASLTVGIANAAASKTDMLHVSLTATTIVEGSATTIGSFTTGLSAAGLSNLEIESNTLGYSGSNMIVLGSIGDIANPVSVTFSGDHHLLVGATTTAQSYIGRIVIDNDDGVDLSGLAWGLQAFDAGGATIIGGKGDDELVGGAGADLIKSGGGDNIVHGSAGNDIIRLALNSGADQLIFDNHTQSLPNGFEDVVYNFGAFDVIDVSGMVSSLSFNGNVATRAAGISVLSSVHASAFFVTAEHILYIDVNHDGAIDTAHDFAILLDGVASFGGGNLID